MEARLLQLQARLQSVRLSRRVLMHLLGSLDRARRDEVERLLATNNRLRWENRRYSLDIVRRDRRIEELEHLLGSAAGSNLTAPTA